MTASEAYLDFDLEDSAGVQSAKVIRLERPAPCGESPGGVVFTRPWVVDLILDLAGYRADRDLAATRVVEPSAGEGAFLVPIIRRLMTSASAHGRSIADVRDSVRAFELDASSAARAIDLAASELRRHGVSADQALGLAAGWVRVGDYLLNSPSAGRADLVVGNPPYIRYDEVPSASLAAYRKMYPTMVGRGDIYVGFLEAGLRQLADGGVLGFICADRWMRSAYGSELRRMVSSAFGVEAVIEMHNAPAFESQVSAYPAVIIIRRAPQGRVIVASGDATAGAPSDSKPLANAITALAEGRRQAVPGFTAGVVDRWFNGTGPWPSLPPEQLVLLRRLEAEFAPLEDEITGTRVGIGVATGADRVFITTDPAAAEPDRMVPLAMTADTRHGDLRWSGNYLIDPWQRGGGLVDLAAYPRLRAYFEQRRKELQSRNVAQRMPRDWYRTIDRVHHDLTGQPKLYFPDMKLTSHPVLDLGETYPHHALYFLTSRNWDLEVLGGLLLSRIAQMFIEAYCVKMRGGTLRFQAQYLRRIRVPDPAAIPAEMGERLRQAFRSRDVTAATKVAAEAYGITDLTGLLTN